MKAVSQSLVELDQPIDAYLPDFAVNSTFEEYPVSSITLRRLLSHTAGFTHEAPLGSNYDIGNGDFDAHCRSISETWLRFVVGHHFEYSNLGIDLAGYALQRVAGVPFAEFAARELFTPLGMVRTTFDAAVLESDPDRATGHWRPFDVIGRKLPVAVPMVAAGGLYTTVQDALRYLVRCLRGRSPLIPHDLFAEQRRVAFPLSGQRLGYGLGVYVDDWAGVGVHHHGGSGFGFQCQLCWAPELDIGVVVLTNSFDNSLPDEIARRIVAEVAIQRGLPKATAGEPVGYHALPEARMSAAADLVGQYVGRLDQGVEVVIEDGQLLVRGEQAHLACLIGPRMIEVQDPERSRYLFTDGPEGSVAYMLAIRDGYARYRNDESLTARSRLDPARVGIYVARSWGVPTGSYRLRQDGNGAVIEHRSDDYGKPPQSTVSLRLSEVAKDLYLSSMGEILDLRTESATYANIALEKVGANGP